eukprot:465832_1
MITKPGRHLSTYIWWRRLFFSHWHETRKSTSVITASSAFACVVCGWCITNSVMNDPEVRVRPHKKAWHITEDNMKRAVKYHGGAFRWMNPVTGYRMKYIDQKIEEGWEELPIPTLAE